MTLITCTRLLGFDAGHRVHEHESKCAHLHGHRYTAELTASGNLDRLGRVVDFGVLKRLVGAWIDDHWDHGFIVWQHDPLVEVLQELHVRESLGETDDEVSEPIRQKLFLLPENPTAENLAAYLLEIVCPQLLEGTGVRVVHVRLWETPNCYADAALTKLRDNETTFKPGDDVDPRLTLF